MNTPKFALIGLAVFVTACGGGDGDVSTAPDAVRAGALASGAVSQVAPMYALDFVGTAATGWDMNDAGDVVGRSYTDTGCGPFCLPPQAATNTVRPIRVNLWVCMVISCRGLSHRGGLPNRLACSASQ